MKCMVEHDLTENWASAVRNGEVDTLLIAGPTASGKSAFAIRLAEKLDGVVFNADSMQVYHDLQILSARPDLKEQAGIPHFLFGFVPAATEYTVGQYIRDAAVALENIRKSGKIAIFVGGTGLYFRALTEGLVVTPPVPDAIRAGLTARAEAGEDMHAALNARDPLAAQRLNPADLPRILRALEIVEATGETLAVWQKRESARPLLPGGRWRGAFLNPSRTVLAERIDRRFELMISAGALEEVRTLLALNLPVNRGVMKAHGVPHLVAHLEGRLSLSDAIVLGQADTRRYAKRQVTWARKFMRDWVFVD